MMRVGVQLEDIGFARALMRGLSAEARNICFVLADEADADFDLILTDCTDRGTKSVHLVKDPGETRIFEGPPYRIFRYTHARDFVSSLLYIFHHETGRNLEFAGDIRCKTLVFASLSGEPETTAIALATGEILYKHYGYHCLYLNLCPIDGSKRFLPEGSGRGFLTLLYHLNQEEDFPLTAFIRQHSQVAYIDTSVSNPYFDELDSVRTHRLLKKIDDLGSFDYLIVDVGNHLSRGNKSLLGQAEEIILVSSETGRFPLSFFKKVTGLLEAHGGEGKMRILALDRPQFTETPAAVPLGEDGLLDLSAMKYIQWDAGRLAKKIAEKTDD